MSIHDERCPVKQVEGYDFFNKNENLFFDMKRLMIIVSRLKLPITSQHQPFKFYFITKRDKERKKGNEEWREVW
jgi:hypothetical protein